MDKAGWDALVGKVIVVDTDSSFVYLGTLKAVDDLFLVMVDVDAHDARESPSTKDQYVMASKQHGVKANRREVSVRQDKVVSVSKLDDVVSY